MAWRIGIDIGGTFTDVALVEEAHRPHRDRQAADHAAGFRPGGDRRASARDWTRTASIRRDVSLLSHATTVVTNALLENKGARAGFIATRGFRDILELRRSSRADLYDLLQDAPAVLVPRRWRFEITERIDAQGEVVTPLAEDELPALIEAIRAAELQTVAVSFLFSFLNDAHERRVGEAAARGVAGCGGVSVLRGAAGDPRVRARQHNGGVCRGRTGAGVLSRSAARRDYATWLAEAARDGIVRRRVRHRRGAADAGDGGGIRTRRRRDRGIAGGTAVGAAQSDLVRHGRHDGQGQRHRRWRGVGHRGIRSRRRRPCQSLDARHRPPDPRAGDRPGRGQRRRRHRSPGSIRAAR